MKCVFGFPNNFCLKHFSYLEEFSDILSQKYTGLYVVAVILVIF